MTLVPVGERWFKVADATRNMAVTLEVRDCRGATPRDPANCVVARGTRRQPGVKAVSIGADVAYVVFKAEPKVARRYKLTTKLRQAVRHFDQHGTFPPMVAVLRAPTEREQLSARAGQSGSQVRTGRRTNINTGAGRIMSLRHIARPMPD